MDISCELGIWLDSAVRNVPRGELSWRGIKGRIYTGALGDRYVLATVRRAPHHPQWVVSLPGFVWDVSGDRGSTTTAALGITTSPARSFRTSKRAMKAVESAYETLLRYRSAEHLGAPEVPGRTSVKS